MNSSLSAFCGEVISNTSLWTTYFSCNSSSNSLKAERSEMPLMFFVTGVLSSTPASFRPAESSWISMW